MTALISTEHDGWKRVKKFRPGSLIGEMSAYTRRQPAYRLGGGQRILGAVPPDLGEAGAAGYRKPDADSLDPRAGRPNPGQPHHLHESAAVPRTQVILGIGAEPRWAVRLLGSLAPWSLRDFPHKMKVLTGRRYGPSLARIASIGPPARLSRALTSCSAFRSEPNNRTPTGALPTTVPSVSGSRCRLGEKKITHHREFSLCGGQSSDRWSSVGSASKCRVIVRPRDNRAGGPIEAAQGRKPCKAGPSGHRSRGKSRRDP